MCQQEATTNNQQAIFIQRFTIYVEHILFMSNINYDMIQAEYKNNSLKLFGECKHYSAFHPEIP